MLRKLLMPAVIAGSLLAGCSTGPNGQPTINIPQISQADVTNAAIKICSFVPAAETVANLIVAALSSGIPGLQTATGIATAICQAVLTNAPAPTAQLRHRRIATPATVLGVPIKGQFLQ